MRPVTEQNFGILIAYVLPGWIALLGVGEFSPDIRMWLGTANRETTIGGFLYSTMSAVALGLVLNTVRQAAVESTSKWCRPMNLSRDYRVLHDRIEAVDFLVLNQFRYHQFHGNSAIACSFTLCVLASHGSISDGMAFAILALIGVMVYGAAKCLSIYYNRLREVLAE